MGDGSKIHAGEIAVAKGLLLDKSVIVDFGSNSNGSWIKFGEGTLICTNQVSHAVAVSTSLGGNTYATAGRYYWNYPYSFIKTPFADGRSLNYLATGVINHGNNSTRLEYRPYHPVTTTASDTKNFILIAIGRWK